MRRTRKALAAVVTAAAAAGTATAALAAPAAGPVAHQRPAVAFTPGSGQLVVDWNRELIAILGTPGAQPATVHPTRSLAILQAAEYDAVTSITHRDPPYLFSVPAPRDARPDAAADQAAHDVLTALYPSMKTGLDAMLFGELAVIPEGSAASSPASTPGSTTRPASYSAPGSPTSSSTTSQRASPKRADGERACLLILAGRSRPRTPM
jgi:hypothetical protein